MHADTPDSPSSPPGLPTVVKRSVRHAQADQIPHLAQAIAFNGFLAIPSALLLAVGVFSATAGPGSIQTLLDHLQGLVPDSVLSLVQASMAQLLVSGRSDLMIAVGAVFALWSLSGAMQTVMWSLNAAHELPRDAGFRAQAARGTADDPGVAAGGRPGGVHAGAGSDDQQLAAGPDRRRRRLVAVGLRTLAAAGAGAAVRVRRRAVSGARTSTTASSAWSRRARSWPWPSG